jgi:hypothetical protein
LDNSADQTFESEIPLHCNQANAILPLIDNRFVIHGLISQIEISWAKMRSSLAECSREDTRHLKTSVSVLEHSGPGTGPQQKHPRIAGIGQRDWPQMDGWRDPLPVSELIAATAMCCPWSSVPAANATNIESSG